KHLFQGSAAAILGIFVPIFLYETFGQEFHYVGLYYALIALLFVIFLVPAMHISNRIGFTKSLILAGFFNIIVFSIMYYLTPGNLDILVGFLLVAITGFKVFHWVPYNVDFTLFTTKEDRGRQVSLTFATTAFLGIIGPIIGGYVIVNSGYNILFSIAVILLIVSTISYIFVPETNTNYDWSFMETWKKFFSRKYRPMMVSEFASGAEATVSIVVWPIFLYDLLSGDVLEIGALSAVIVSATIIIQLFIGNRFDLHGLSKKRTLQIGSSLYALGWIIKIFILSAAHVFFVGLFHNLARIFTKTPFMAIMYDMSGDQGDYVDEFTVLRELALHMGKIFSLLAISVLTLFIPLAWTFMIAAIASIALNFIHSSHSAK
ncbi:MAG: MFS family permease, partial [Candidatus Paceibacteria bacterium]